MRILSRIIALCLCSLAIATCVYAQSDVQMLAQKAISDWNNPADFGFEKEYTGKLQSTVEKTLEYYPDGKQTRIVVVRTSVTAEDCGTCHSVLGILEFVKGVAGWKQTFAQMNAGAYDNAVLTAQIQTIGTNNYAIRLLGGGTGQGFITQTYILIARLADAQAYAQIFFVETHKDNLGRVDNGLNDPQYFSWDAQVFVEPYKVPFHDIKVVAEGTNVNPADDVLKPKPFRTSSTYRYNSEQGKYVEVSK